MNKKITKLMAALALLLFMTPAMVGWGQTTSTLTLSNTKKFGTSSGSTLNTETTPTIIWTVNKTSGSGAIQNSYQSSYHGQQFGTSSAVWGGTFSATYSNTVTSVKVDANTGGSATLSVTVGGTSFYCGNNTSVAVVKNSNSTGPNYYEFTGSGTGAVVISLSGSSKACYFGGVVVTYTTGGVPSPSMSVSPSSIDFGSNAINPANPYTQTFDVTFANLTQNLTVTGFSGVTVSPTTISANATSPQTVTVSYNPTTAGSISGNISVNSSEVTEQLVAVTGSAYDPANIPTYKLVSDASTLHAGDIIILGCASKSTVAGAMGANAYFSKVDASFTDGTVATNAAIQITLGGSAGAWTLTTSEGQIGVSSTNLNHNGEGTTTWTISISNNVAHINGGTDNGDIQYNASSPRFKTYTSSQTSIEIYKLVNENQVATPTFSVEAGTYLSAQSVSISCETEGATIQYKTSENGEWQNYSTVINVNETMTIWAKATKAGMDESEIATATYTIVIIEHAGTEADPYSVADARNLIDLGEPYPDNVYATGIVSEIVTAYNSQYGNITYNISTDGTTASAQLQAYRGKSYNGENFTSADDIQVGDIVVVKGKLTKYNSTYEFDANNQLVSLVRPIDAPNVSITYSATSGSIAYIIDNSIEGGVLTAATESDWLTLPSTFASPIQFTCTANTTTTARTATVVLTYTYNRATVTKNVTVTQAAYEAPIVTWDLSIDQTATATTIEMTWTSDYATMGVAKANATTNTNNYYPGTVGQNYTSTRFYAGSVLTIAPIAGYAITSVVFDATTNNYANALKDSNWTNATASVTEDIVTVIPTNRTNAFSAVIGATCGFTSVTVYYLKAYTLTIDGYAAGSAGGYRLIASPVTVKPADVQGMILTGENAVKYDLFYFDQSNMLDDTYLEWVNYKSGNNPNFNLEPGKGYLYAQQATTEGQVYHFTLSGSPYTGNGIIPLDYDASARFAGWNLIGNPYATAATLDKPFYKMDADGVGFGAEIEDLTNTIAAMEGVFVQVNATGQSATFTPQRQSNQPASIAYANIVVNDKKGSVLDNAIVRFDNGETLGKFQLNRNSTKVYFSENNNDYAIVRGEEMGAMPVNFKAENNGTYTLNVSGQNTEFAYLHLIDNMTGNDVDLLQTPSYSFEAKTTDYESRFKLVFATGDNSNDDTFAFYSNGSFVINNEGNAELQVIDVTGRIVKSESINGCANVNVNGTTGVYMLRLVNGDNVKVQKVVVK